MTLLRSTIGMRAMLISTPALDYEQKWLDAILGGDIKACRALLDAGMNVRSKIAVTDSVIDWRHALHYAAESGNRELCALLLEGGATTLDKDKEGNTPLHYAAVRGQLVVVEQLIGAGANVGRTNRNNSTPLHWASANGFVEVCRKLVEHGADPSFVPHNPGLGYMTPFQSAIYHNQTNVVSYFVLECNEDLGQKTLEGESLQELGGRHSLMEELLNSLQTEAAVRNAFPDSEPANGKSRNGFGGAGPL